MSGRCNGVAARVKAEAKLAFYVHCYAYCLHLIISDSVKTELEVDCFCLFVFCIAAKIVCVYVWITCSWNVVVSSEGHIQRCTQRATETEWHKVGLSVIWLQKSYGQTVSNLACFAWDRCREQWWVICGSTGYFHWHWQYSKILCNAKCLSDILQALSLDLTRAVNLIYAPQETLADCRAVSF